MKNLLYILSALCLIALSSCSDDDDDKVPVFPAKFPTQDYTIRAGIATTISFENGGGNYEIEVGDSKVLGRPYMNINGRSVYVMPLSTGTSTMTVKDIRTNTETTINITVVEMYMEFIIKEIKEGNITPHIQEGDELRFVRASGNKRKLEIWRGNTLITTGKFDILMNSVATMQFFLPDGDSTDEKDFITYEYDLTGSPSIFVLFNKGFDFNWEKIVDCRGAVHPTPMIMRLTDKNTRTDIVCSCELNVDI
jgi:hypothetical protein